jgi:hypothetical protein
MSHSLVGFSFGFVEALLVGAMQIRKRSKFASVQITVDDRHDAGGPIVVRRAATQLAGERCARDLIGLVG